jgi:hypothetical protein
MGEEKNFLTPPLKLGFGNVEGVGEAGRGLDLQPGYLVEHLTQEAF